MSTIKINHYLRPSVAAKEKRLVTEVVSATSSTGRFLDKMEQKRLRRPCYQTIDMRGKVPGECRRHVLHDREYYLDDISHSIYEQGLADNNGVFTVGTYEAIVNGGHTNKSIRQVQEEQYRQSRRGAAAAAPESANDAAPDADARYARCYNPEIVPLGYYKKRCEERLQHATACVVHADGMQYTGTTRDISVGGLQVALKGVHAFEAGAELAVSLTGLAEEVAHVDLNAIGYRIVHSEQREAGHILRLRLERETAPAGLEALIRNLIERYRRKHRLDVEDNYWSMTAWLYERLYVESLAQIPFFIGKDSRGELYVQAVAVTDGNQPLAQFFRNDVENYDFSPLCIPARLAHLRDAGETLLILFRDKNEGHYRIHSAADCEFADARERDGFLRYAFVHEEHCVVKLTAARIPTRRPSEKKIDVLTGRLREKSEQEANQLTDSLGDLLFAGMMMDVTEQVRETLLGIPAPDQGADLGELACWVGASRRRLADGAQLEQLDQQFASRPEIVRFGYVERRREERYIAETRVELAVGRARHQGATRDISIRGLCVKTDERIDLKPGDEITISFLQLQEKRRSVNLRNVPYRVVNVRSGPVNLLMLERLAGDRDQELHQFFLELIQTNRHKLAVDTDDARSATAARLYEGYTVENLPTVPFFIARNDDGGASIQGVAVPDQPCPLAEFFRDPDGNYDFRLLTDSRVVVAVYGAIGDMIRGASVGNQRPSPCELEMYFYKTLDAATGRPMIVGASEHEFAAPEQKEAFIGTALEHQEFRFVKLSATYTTDIDKRELESAIEQVREHARHRAFQLQQRVAAVVGYGELLDITREVVAGRR